jgi:hypothetical protein
MALPLVAHAGDEGTLTLDAQPSTAYAGQGFRLGFTVRSQGQPVDVWDNQPVQPYLSATNATTGESLTLAARRDGPPGHFVVDVTLPSAGTWAVHIKAEPLVSAPWTGSLTILPAHMQAHTGGAAAANGATLPARSVLGRIISTLLVAMPLIFVLGLLGFGYRFKAQRHKRIARRNS